MFTRTTGLLIVPAWLAAMSWLVAHDVWPGWTALDPPPLGVSRRLEDRESRSQFTITGESGIKVGTVWTTYRVDETAIRRDDLIWVEWFPIDVVPFRITVSSDYTVEGVLDEFSIRLETEEAEVKLHGERFPSDFSFRLESGPIDKVFKIPLSSGGMIAGAFNPFSELRDLRVGTKWRMQVVNPIALLTGVGNRFIPLLVEVTGEERIATSQGVQTCLVVESPSAKAWLDADGRVQVQEITLPVGGALRIVREAGFNEGERLKARRASLGGRRTRQR